LLKVCGVFDALGHEDVFAPIEELLFDGRGLATRKVQLRIFFGVCTHTSASRRRKSVVL
jgi:hypothetical protein